MADPAKMRYCKWWLADWRGSETRGLMDAAERGVYLEALFLNYAEGSIPADHDALTRLLAVTPAEFAHAWPKVSRKFNPHPTLPGRLVNPRVFDAMTKEEAFRESAAERGRQGAEKRWGDRVPHQKGQKNRVPHELANGKTIASTATATAIHSVRSDERTASANGNGRYPEWFELFWKAYPSEFRGGKKAGYDKALRCLARAGERDEAAEVLRRELLDRQAREERGEFVPRLPNVERWFSKDYHHPAAERQAQPATPQRPELPPMKMAWEE